MRTFNAPVKKLMSGETIELDEKSSLDVIDSPGHTMDHQVFIWRSAGTAPVLYSGDTLFNAGVGNCKGGGNVDDLYETVKSLTTSLPLDTILQPGHDYLKRNLEFVLNVDPENKRAQERLKMLQEDPLMRSPLTLAEEQELNPFLKADREQFIKLRSLRDKW